MTYLDHAATTPMVPEAVHAMSEAMSTLGNASSLHTSGRRTRRAVEEARESLGAALGARPSEVIFTAGGTESDNLAVKGIYWARQLADPRRRRVLASSVEHHAVLDAVQWLGARGAEIVWLEPDALGRVDENCVRAAIGDEPETVALITVMLANNEVGTVNPVRSIASVAREFDIPLHTDAVQAVGQLDVDFTDLGVSALTMTGHKVGGPFGAGVLLLARDVACTPVLHGGGQERDVRSGTLDRPAIVGLATATKFAVDARAEREKALTRLREQVIGEVRAAVPDAVLNGDTGESIVDGLPSRLPGNAHFTFPGCEGDSLLMLLDAKGIECSTGSACTAGVAQPSHVLSAMGVEHRIARGSLRFSLGHTSTEDDVRALGDAIGPVVERARSAGLSNGLRGVK